MRKRTPVVVLSSEDDDEPRGRVPSRGLVSSRPGPRSAPTARKRPRGWGSKKDPSSASRGVGAVDFDMLSEDFCGHLHDFSISKGVMRTKKNELWAEKHKPRSLMELAVHKKKIDEVKRWLEERMTPAKEGIRNCVLLITGKSGVGKSTSIHVIASLLGVELCEWMTPTPTLWQEHVHNSNSGVQYMSKLDEFVSFVEKIRKYSLLRPAYMGESRKPVILLIDDIPVTNGKVALAKLKNCLKNLIQSVQVPTVILVSEYHKIESSDSLTEYWEELELFIEQAGAFKVAFNPITENSIKKRLTKICQEENCAVPSHWIDHIARVSGGDIRHAIISLQYCCLQTVGSSPIHASTLNVSPCELNSDNPVLLSTSSSGNTHVALPWGRDEKITLFHALGKFLHNKREAQHAFELAPDSFALREKFARNPLKMDTPEEVIRQAHGQAQTITDFLHENVLDFVSDEAVENAWLVTSYLSDADCILASTLRPRFYRISDSYESDNIRQLIAASVAVRGVLFGNSHPSPSRWHTIRTPKLWQTEQTLRHNKVRMLPERFEAYNTYSFCSLSSIATEYRPTNQWICSRTIVDANMRGNILENTHGADDINCSNENLEETGSEETEEDDIEDW